MGAVVTPRQAFTGIRFVDALAAVFAVAVVAGLWICTP